MRHNQRSRNKNRILLNYPGLLECRIRRFHQNQLKNRRLQKVEINYRSMPYEKRFNSEHPPKETMPVYMSEELKLVVMRQQQLRQAALVAKQRGDLQGAKESLTLALRMDKMVGSSFIWQLHSSFTLFFRWKQPSVVCPSTSNKSQAHLPPRMPCPPLSPGNHRSTQKH
jgi:hypothetical protein